jgi:hypothetical protein
MNSRVIRAACWYRNIWVGVHLAVFALGMTLVVDAGQYAPGALLIALGAVFTYRATQLRLTVTSSHVVIASWLLRRSIQRSAIIRFESGVYVPIFLKGATIRALEVLFIIVDSGETHDVPFLVGRRGKIQRLVYDLNTGFRVEEPRDGHRHRAP